MKNQNCSYFWAGFAVHAACACFIQDWMGKEKYIEYVNNFWLDVHWGVWIALVCILFFTIFCSHKFENNLKTKRLRMALTLVEHIEQTIIEADKKSKDEQ